MILSRKPAELHLVLDAIMRPYKERVPDVQHVLDSMKAFGFIDNDDDIQNDHIAFRTLGVKHLGIASFEKVFLAYGYTKEDYYFFEGKKLNAYWYAPPSPEFPRIFVSELRVADLSVKAQSIIQKYMQHLTCDPVSLLDFTNPKEIGTFFHKPLWALPTIEDYKALAAESEYAAWVIYNRYYLNHFTVTITDLPAPHNELEQFNQFLENIGVVLNDSGGKIKTSSDGLLLQSASVAKMETAVFRNGEKMKIPGSYVEFAQRKVLPEFSALPAEMIQRHHRREGFESANADKIFESTYSGQTQKNTRIS